MGYTYLYYVTRLGGLVTEPNGTVIKHFDRGFIARLIADGFMSDELDMDGLAMSLASGNVIPGSSELVFSGTWHETGFAGPAWPAKVGSGISRSAILIAVALCVLILVAMLSM